MVVAKDNFTQCYFLKIIDKNVLIWFVVIRHEEEKKMMIHWRKKMNEWALETFNVRLTATAFQTRLDRLALSRCCWHSKTCAG
jgi:hypothetical protein